MSFNKANSDDAFIYFRNMLESRKNKKERTRLAQPDIGLARDNMIMKSSKEDHRDTNDRDGKEHRHECDAIFSELFLKIIHAAAGRLRKTDLDELQHDFARACPEEPMLLRRILKHLRECWYTGAEKTIRLSPGDFSLTEDQKAEMRHHAPAKRFDERKLKYKFNAVIALFETEGYVPAIYQKMFLNQHSLGTEDFKLLTIPPENCVAARILRSKRNKQQRHQVGSHRCENPNHYICQQTSTTNHLRSEIDPCLVNKIIHHLCCESDGPFAQYKFVEWEDMLYGNIHEIRGLPQFGKTKAMLMLGWILYFKCGTPMLLIPRSDSAAYSDIKSSVNDFNLMIRETIYLLRGSKRGCPTDAYALKYICTRDKKSTVEEIINGGHPFVYARVGTAGNVRKIAEDILPIISRNFGASNDGYINCALMIDEAQNTIGHAGLHKGHNKDLHKSNRFKLDKAYHFDSYDGVQEALCYGIARETLGADSNFEMTVNGYLADEENCRIPASLADAYDTAGEHIRSRSEDGKSLQFGIFKCVRHVVLVSATMAPTLINQNHATGNVIAVPTPAVPHCGYHPSLNQEAQIPCYPIKVPERVSISDPITQNCPALFDVVKNSVMDSSGFHHVLAYLSLGRNQKIDEAITVMREQHWKSPKPVILMTAYATANDENIQKRCGVRITGNLKAQEILKMVENADKALHTAPLNRRRPPGMYYGDMVTCSDGRNRKLVRKGGDLRAYGEIYEIQALESDPKSIALEIRLPKSGHYRVRTALSIVQKAISLASVQLDHVKLVTVGASLLREGVTVKTNDHRLAATRMIICSSLTSLQKWDHGRLIQVSARIAGLMHAGQSMPEFYAPSDVIHSLREAYKFQGALYSAVDRGRCLGENPVKAIRNQNVNGFGKAPSANIAKPNQMPETIIDDVTHGSTFSCDDSGGENCHVSASRDDEAFLDGFDDNGIHAHWKNRKVVGSRSRRPAKRRRVSR